MSSAFADFAAQWRAAGLMASGAQPSKPPDIGVLLADQRMERFKALCPLEFQQPIDRARLPNLVAWDEADAWSGEAPGLWLWSHETGRGKTRMAWRQFGRAHVRKGQYVLKATGQSLCESYFEAHMDGDPRAFYRRMLQPDLLIIDDLDKAEITERNRRAIRELFDELYSHRKAVIVTSNEPIEFFNAGLGESCVRRMREVCREIRF